jgi:KDO2-lipid IV(A) lauroyltransferase
MAVVGAGNLRELARACRRGEGTFVFTGHFGNWELLVRVFATIIPTTVVARRMRHPLADALVQAHRARGGAEVVYQDDDPRAVLRALRSGRAVGTLFDQDIPALAGVFVPWFGRLANTPSGPAALALLARVAVQPVYCHRQAGRWVLHAGPRTVPGRGGDRAAAIAALTAGQTAYLEALVRRFPAQWVWWHKRWRIRPPGEGDAVAAPAPAPGSAP